MKAIKFFMWCFLVVCWILAINYSCQLFIDSKPREKFNPDWAVQFEDEDEITLNFGNDDKFFPWTTIKIVSKDKTLKISSQQFLEILGFPQEQ